jgi:hypothetical protein
MAQGIPKRLGVGGVHRDENTAHRNQGDEEDGVFHVKFKGHKCRSKPIKRNRSPKSANYFAAANKIYSSDYE